MKVLGVTLALCALVALSRSMPYNSSALEHKAQEQESLKNESQEQESLKNESREQESSEQESGEHESHKHESSEQESREHENDSHEHKSSEHESHKHESSEHNSHEHGPHKHKSSEQESNEQESGEHEHDSHKQESSEQESGEHESHKHESSEQESHEHKLREHENDSHEHKSSEQESSKHESREHDSHEHGPHEHKSSEQESSKQEFGEHKSDNHDSLTHLEPSELLPCPAGWTRFRDRCFIFIETPKTWIEAEIYCQFDRGNLASVHSYEENRFITSLTRGDTETFPQSWIGGSDAVHHGHWMWTDGSEFQYNNCYEHNSDEGSDEGDANCLKINFEGNKRAMHINARVCMQTFERFYSFHTGSRRFLPVTDIRPELPPL
uniref:C-type lectin domain-containing protein n=1 Tax=Monopterus albus TaxID=43700 RepID=A0A3Q3QAN4_MONAL